MNTQKSFSINRPLVFVVNCDWRDIFRTAPLEFEDKIKRDHLGLDRNNFFYLSFAKKEYKTTVKNYTTIHLKTCLGLVKPLLDLKALIVVPLIALHWHLRPTIWLSYDFGFLPALWLAKKFFGGKIVMVLTNQPRIYSRTRNLGMIKSVYSSVLERMFKSIPDQFLTINETMKSYLEDLNVPPSKISIFSTDTINRDRQFINKASKGQIRKKLNLSTDTKIILSIGRLEPEKNFSKLITLFSELPSDYVLIILGQGQLLPTLLQEVKSQKLEGRVFFEGFIDRENIWYYYLDADVFVLISLAEALGMVFWEAMALGIPVLGSTAPGIVETIGHDKDRGRLWAENEGIAGFKEKIEFCVGQSPEKEQILVRAKAFVEEKIKNDITLNDVII